MGLRPWSRVSLSLPVWEEWIEIKVPVPDLPPMFQSLPVWEEWIEMVHPIQPLSGELCLFPYGKSGLKSLLRGQDY